MDKETLKGKISDRIHKFDEIFPEGSTLFDNIVDEAVSEYSRYKPIIRSISFFIESDEGEFELPSDFKTVFDVYYLDDGSRFYPNFAIENDKIILKDIRKNTNFIVKYFTTRNFEELNHADKALKEHILYQIYDYLADSAAQTPNFSMGDQRSDNYQRYTALTNKSNSHLEKFESLVLNQKPEMATLIVNQSIREDGELQDAIQDDNWRL
ncbi:MAG: hypothetical protein ACOCQD_03140 [archaeon]